MDSIYSIIRYFWNTKTMKTPKVFFDKPIKTKEDKLMMLIDMLVANNGQHTTALCQLKNEFEAHRRLQGIYNVLFGVTVGVLMVVAIRGL